MVDNVRHSCKGMGFWCCVGEPHAGLFQKETEHCLGFPHFLNGPKSEAQHCPDVRSQLAQLLVIRAAASVLSEGTCRVMY